MSDTPETPGTPEGPFAEVPLFAELQRVLFSGSGPVNWELARQVGIAVAVQDGDPDPTEQDRRELEETVRLAELQVADLTGLSSPPGVATVEAVRRSQWVETGLRGLRGLFEPGAERMAKALAEAEQPETIDEAAEGPLPGLGAIVERMPPLLMGVQVGMVLGQLGRQVLTQYDVPFPRDDRPALRFVVGNLARFEKEWSLPRTEFRAWAALHETTHAFQLARPWVHAHVLGLVKDVAEGLQIDLAAIEERLSTLDPSDPEALSRAIGDPAELFGQAVDEEQRLRIGRLQAFVAAAEGHADHVMSIVGGRILGSYARIDEAMRRHHEARGAEERVTERLLGLDVGQDLHRLAREFCDRVAELAGEATLAGMWEGAEALPSMPELEEPTLWLSRIV